MNSPQSAWYRTRAGRIFLIIISIIALSFFVFGGLIGYYYWRIQRGGRAELQKTFSSQFTLNPGQTAATGSGQSPNDLIRPYTPTRGERSAPVTIVEFIDFECPFCQDSFPIFEKVIRQFGPALRLAFKHIPVTQIHPAALDAHLAAACAAEQKKFWPYYQALFTAKKLDPMSLRDYGKNLNLDLAAFDRCVESKKYLADIETDIRDAADFGVRGTPTYFVNGQKLEGVVPEEIWSKIIIDEIKKSSPQK